ncbi:MAG: hypothetical protein IPL40_00445 [Proteobacteria bacterium]|nr:hypothetical protein [Pseudomonadota bacterium]
MGLLLAATLACTRSPAADAGGEQASARAPAAGGGGESAASFVRCTRAAPIGDADTAPRRLGTFELLTLRAGQLEPRPSAGWSGQPRRSAGSLRLGVLADTHEALPQTLAQLARLVDRFAAARVDAVAVLGGIDSAFVGAVRILRALRGPWTLLALAGDRSSAEGFQAALRHADPAAIDLTRTQIVALPALTVIGVAGYHLPHHALAGAQGCGYDAADLALLGARLRGTARPRLLLAHGPPRGRGPDAVDRAWGAINIGDPALRPWIASAEVRFGVFGHVHEAAGRATRLDGSPLAPGVWSDSLLLQVGSSDGLPHHQRANDPSTGEWSGATAAVIEIDGERARYAMITVGGTKGGAHAGTSSQPGAF